VTVPGLFWSRLWRLREHGSGTAWLCRRCCWVCLLTPAPSSFGSMPFWFESCGGIGVVVLRLWWIFGREIIMIFLRFWLFCRVWLCNFRSPLCVCRFRFYSAGLEETESLACAEGKWVCFWFLGLDRGGAPTGLNRCGQAVCLDWDDNFWITMDKIKLKRKWGLN